MDFRTKKLILFLLINIGVVTFTAACSGVEIVSRSQWSARPVSRRNSIRMPVKHVIIGHTVTPQCLSKNDCSAQMRNMQKHHINIGWGDIGYNFVIGGDGRVYEGAGWTQEGIHTYGWNSKSYGIAFVGNYQQIVPNAKMLKAAKSLIICGILSGRIADNREIHGARDATCTASPGAESENEIKKTLHGKKFQTRIVIPTVSGLRCKKLHKHCRFNQDCCPGTYCYEEEGDSHERRCDV